MCDAADVRAEASVRVPGAYDEEGGVRRGVEQRGAGRALDDPPTHLDSWMLLGLRA